MFSKGDNVKLTSAYRNNMTYKGRKTHIDWEIRIGKVISSNELRVYVMWPNTKQQQVYPPKALEKVE